MALAVDEDDVPVFEADVAAEEDFDPEVVDAPLDAEAPEADVAPPPRGAVERPSISLWTDALKAPFMPFILLNEDIRVNTNAGTAVKDNIRELSGEGESRELRVGRVLQGD